MHIESDRPGFDAALVFAAAAVLWMVDYLEGHSLAIFGWYRIALAGTITALTAGGVIG